ncbi:MAG: diaminopimelate epimerase [Bacteroidetes Order II. Incertae sedis bacterium]|jgi:diaminopimelate epimerase|nr:diaminopimelate epimerase [Bacteroidetes Order II. bacterium]MBT4052806.1 diaminopimelate epimerase [Bacteroidetes Order II. bacterium]MBT5250698.1 diaminopimelate epimerase [Bacteroidetes Order II. bacterium]MBT6201974.1 diaminopimelate epimerase [Bacteroidetes Order II. bacterium]MBT6425791.1 diaminopimelate epimerase [Bacteroidetes Order II. bacterium]
MSIQSRKLIVEFTKMSGAGNDFIVIDNRFYNFSRDELSEMAKNLCRRRISLGADGILALCNPDTEGASFRMMYYNADGSLGTMCGNGARCLARFAREAGLMEEPLVFDSDAGLYAASVGEDASLVRLFVPAPKGYVENIPLDGDLPNGSTEAHYIWTGTQHLVIPVEDVSMLNLTHLGPRLRADAGLGEEGANVNFVEQTGDATFHVRTFEKGVEAETLACGTGSIASALVSHRTGKTRAQEISVRMPGGELKVGFEGPSSDPQKLYLEGAADLVYRGTLEL